MLYAAVGFVARHRFPSSLPVGPAVVASTDNIACTVLVKGWEVKNNFVRENGMGNLLWSHTLAKGFLSLAAVKHLTFYFVLFLFIVASACDISKIENVYRRADNVQFAAFRHYALQLL